MTDVLITKTRKQRIIEKKRQEMKKRNVRVAGLTLAAALSTSVLTGGVKQANAKSGNGLYTVQQGDTLYKISKQFKTTVASLKKANTLSSDTIYAGQKLAVRESYHLDDETEYQNTKNYTIKTGDNLYRIAKNHGTTVQQLMKVNGLKSDLIYVGQVVNIPHPTSNTHEQLVNVPAVYTVVPGDTLWELSKRFNVSIADIKKTNGLKNEVILIGQKLVVTDNAVSVSATIVGAADNFTVEFSSNGKTIPLKVAYGTAQNYEKYAGKNVILTYKNNALINVLF